MLHIFTTIIKWGVLHKVYKGIFVLFLYLFISFLWRSYTHKCTFTPIPSNPLFNIIFIYFSLAIYANSIFSPPGIELKHLCLEYMTPWLSNLVRFCKHNDDAKRQRVTAILDKLITMTINEKQMYPSIQAKIWGSLGQVLSLLKFYLVPPLCRYLVPSLCKALSSVQL